MGEEKCPLERHFLMQFLSVDRNSRQWDGVWATFKMAPV